MAWNPQAYPNYNFQAYNPYPVIEDPEAIKAKKAEEEKELIEKIESNRLYQRKVKKECLEEFVDLNKIQLFLFEVIIELLEVTDDSSLGLVTDSNDLTYINARIKFLNSPYLQICNEDKTTCVETTAESEASENFQTTVQSAQGQMGNTWVHPIVENTSMGPSTHQERDGKSKNITWDHARGKSCLFSMTPMQIIRDLSRHPVEVQVVRCTFPQTQASKEADEYEPIAYALFQLPEQFGITVLQSCKEGVTLPVSCVHRETYDLKNSKEVKKGKIDLFVRLSSFGPVIKTSFQPVGEDRKYVFKPSSVAVDFEQSKVEVRPEEILKPLLADEDKAAGISILKDTEIYQRPVLWETNTMMCGCQVEREAFYGNKLPSLYASISSKQLPTLSESSLCHHVRPPTDYRKVKPFKKSDLRNQESWENCDCLSTMYLNKYKHGYGLKDYKGPKFKLDGTDKKPSKESQKDTKKNTCDCCPCLESDSKISKTQTNRPLGFCGWPTLKEPEKIKAPFGKEYFIRVPTHASELNITERKKRSGTDKTKVPIAKCGCILAKPVSKNKRISREDDSPTKTLRPILEADDGIVSKAPTDSSRIVKMRPLELDPKVNYDVQGCGCECPAIKDYLDAKKVFSI